MVFGKQYNDVTTPFPRMSLKHDMVSHDAEEVRHSLESRLSHSSRLHSLKASSVFSDCCQHCSFCSDLHDHKNHPSRYSDSGFESLQSPIDDTIHEDEDDANHEKRCIVDATMLLTQCICSSPRLNHYKLRQLLGYGTFGIVVEAVDPSSTSHATVAIKIMRKSQIHQNRVYHDPDTGDWSTLEVVLLKYSPPNENIIRYIDSWDDSDCLYLVTELGGNAWNYEPIDLTTNVPVSVAIKLGVDPQSMVIRNSSRPLAETITVSLPDRTSQSISIPLSPNDRSSTGLLRTFGAFTPKTPKYEGCPVVPEQIQKHVLKQLVSAVSTLHHNGITHKDIKDENVLLDKHLNLRLIDFGHAAVYRTQAGDQIKRFKTYGTPVFSPPEARSGIDFHGPSADIYAMGLMLYEYNFGDVPDNFDEAVYEPNGDCIFEISRSTGFKSQECMDLCRWMLQPDPTKRATIQDVLAHSYLN